MEDKSYSKGGARWGNRYREKPGVSIKEEWTGSSKFEEDCNVCDCTEELRNIYNRLR